MAFVKVLAVALCLAAANGAPQLLRTVHSVPATRTVHALPVATQTLVRAAPAATVSSHSSHVTHHEVPSVVRSAVVAHPVEHAVVRTAPAYVEHELETVEEGDASYSFGYSVADALSGDSKTREETADHGVVRGSYSVAQPDGRVRVVSYTADAVNGFQADVTYDGEHAAPAIPIDAAPATTVVASAAPAATVISARDSAVHAVHAVPAAQTVVRTAPAVHAVHAVPAAQTVVRTAPAVHALPTAQVLRSNVAQTVVHAQPAATVVRAATPVQTVHALPSAQVFRSNLVHAQPATTLVHAAQPTTLVHAAQPAFVRASPLGTTQSIHA